MKSIVQQIWDAQDRILTVNFAETAGNLSAKEIEDRDRCRRLLKHFERAFPKQWEEASKRR